MSISAIIAAAGSGERFGAGIPKALIQLADRTLLEHAISSLAPVVDQIIITAPAGFEKQISELAGEGIVVVTGGATRSASVRNGLAVAAGEYVLVHDAARALASTDLATRVIAQLHNGEVAVVPALAVVDTIKVTNSDGFVVSTPDRASLVSIQTPQGFKYQASIRDNSGVALLNKLVAIKISLLAGTANGASVYTEVHNVVSSDFGIVNLNIGNGTTTSGNFSTIDWGNNTYFIKTEIDVDNNASYDITGTSQLLSVPYALYANSSGNSQATTPNLESVLAVNNSANNLQIKNLANPTAAQDASTKQYVDSKILLL